MNLSISELAPEAIWRHFYALTRIPRPSGHEEAVIAHLEAFAHDHDLDCTKDKTGNLIIRKGAAPGREAARTVILQSHVDMVPQKNSDKEHDFLKDPIEMVRDGDWIRANETTLGADNGIGIAATLAVLESDTIIHGPLEALFTISEETGMDGAFGLEPGTLKGEILLNLDSEEEGELFMGCAGGVDVNIEAGYAEEEVTGMRCLKITVGGLKGGHSGLDINLGRANANLVLAELINDLADRTDLQIHSFSGGNLRNAIPREAEALITLGSADMELFQNRFRKISDAVKNDFSETEPDMRISYEDAEAAGTHMKKEDQHKILDIIKQTPVGVLQMSEEMQGIVQTSNNMAVVKMQEGKLEIRMLLRSSSDEEKDKYAKDILKLYKEIEADSGLSGAYPGWLPNTDSEILKHAKAVYRELFNTDAKDRVIHAGLECGIIGGTYPDLDMLSFGPTIRFPHSPDEKVHIESVGAFWKFLVKILESI